MISAYSEQPSPIISLHILGNFALQVGGIPVPSVSEHASHLRSLLCYLIVHRERAISHTELIDTFYSDEAPRDPGGALKMQITRLRGMLSPLLPDGASPILGRRGTYQWNATLPCYVDAEEFEALCAAAAQPGAGEDEQLAHYRRALALYHGEPVLEKNGLLWSRTLSARYFKLYLTAVQRCAALLLAREQYMELESICREAIELDPTNEALHLPAMQALLAQEKYAEAHEHYRRLADLLHQEFGVHPSDELQQLYSVCLEREQHPPQDLDGLVASMHDPDDAPCAFFCAFELFQRIYQLELRRARRNGECLHLVMLSVSTADGGPIPGGTSGPLMERVRQSILVSLRRSDVVAQYSAGQFIILLPCANLENSIMVSERIVRTYASSNPHSAARLTYQVRGAELY